ncbi:polysaccharide export protein EpsE [Curvibacter sp. CHRR-16]|uniref:polysaccharide export protein EpsE n=1 Tax=Curvibacter sp. CHRR-16 TaxID=2835872 RepID=UPI002023ADC0|nr:polysaccharide export protein EpsE [Curvibacter sp. CHRR-16]
MHTQLMTKCARWLGACCIVASAGLAFAQDKTFEDKLGPGDVIKVQVYQSPDLSIETRILESGDVSYPLVGTLRLAGLSIPEAEAVLVKSLKSGGFLRSPQVNITVTQARRKVVSILGAVGRPGQFPLEYNNARLSDVLALAGGILPTGSDTVIITGQRGGKPWRQEIDVASLYLDGKAASDIPIQGGEVVYVHRAPVFYVYGEAQRPGSYRIERNMTFVQALVTAGGPTQRGTEKRLKLFRQDADGKVREMSPELSDMVRPDDVIYVRESLF